jgi:uncharacterized protein YndB with AHSA1/START domain
MTSQPSAPGPDLPPVVRAAWVARPADEAFTVFTDEIGAWWPLPSHGLFGREAGGVAFRDGHLVEQATDGREVVWGEVRVWDPPRRLVISWHPGRSQPDASEVEVLFIPDGDGTRVVLEHRGWEAFGREAEARRRRYVGPNAWGYVLDHFGDGAEPHPEGADLGGLESAYAEFFTEAGLGGFGSPPDGEWTAEEVLAHVTLNDAAMLAVCQAVVHGQELGFENLLCQDRSSLARWIEACGDLEGLVERGRASSRQVVAALKRLSPDQRSTLVHCRLEDDAEVMVDDSLPWEAVAIETQATRHLPAHTAQLRDLRA